MNDNDRDVLSAVRDSISALPMPKAPRLEAVTARGRARQRHRLAGASVVAAGACAALVAGLAGGGGPASPASQHGAPAIRLAAFSVASGPGGVTTLTLYPGQVADPNAVGQALARHGIPALVTANSFCRTEKTPAASGQVLLPDRVRPPGARKWPPAITINPAAIPAGSKLSIGYRQDRTTRQISATLIRAGAPLTCTSIINTEYAVHKLHPLGAK